MASALAAVSRLSVAALSVSAQSSTRASIEAAINDDIQSIQREDSYFTREWIEENTNDDDAFEMACKDPVGELSDYLQSVVPETRLEGIVRTFDIITIPEILKISYSFEGPEQQVSKEIRVIELNPNFASQCYRTL